MPDNHCPTRHTIEVAQKNHRTAESAPQTKQRPPVKSLFFWTAKRLCPKLTSYYKKATHYTEIFAHKQNYSPQKPI